MLAQITRTKIRTAALILAIAIGSSGLAVAQDWRYNDHDRDDYHFDRDHDRDALRIARDFGFQDGRAVGQEDMYKRKPVNPYPRGKYAHEDHGYRHEYADKYSYKAEYARAYRDGYERAYR